MDKSPLRPADLVTDYWSREPCQTSCSYVLSQPGHVHEVHVDGSTAVVVWSPEGRFTLLEFQDVFDW